MFNVQSTCWLHCCWCFDNCAISRRSPKCQQYWFHCWTTRCLMFRVLIALMYADVLTIVQHPGDLQNVQECTMFTVSVALLYCWCFDNCATSRRRCWLSLSNCKYCRSPENISHRRGQCWNWGEDKYIKVRAGNLRGGVIPCKYKSQNIRQSGQRSKRNCADENLMQILPIRELVSG